MRPSAAIAEAAPCRSRVEACPSNVRSCFICREADVGTAVRAPATSRCHAEVTWFAYYPVCAPDKALCEPKPAGQRPGGLGEAGACEGSAARLPSRMRYGHSSPISAWFEASASECRSFISLAEAMPARPDPAIRVSASSRAVSSDHQGGLAGFPRHEFPDDGVAGELARDEQPAGGLGVGEQE